MKVVAFNGSPRTKGNTYTGLKIVLAELEREGIGTELVQLGGSRVYGCTGCFKCYNIKNRRCAREDDDMNVFIEKAVDADGMIIGTPVYFSNVSPEVRAFIDRCGMVAKNNNDMLQRKVGASVISLRRAGAIFAYSAINLFYGVSQMIVPGSIYWNLAGGGMTDEVLDDAEEEEIETETLKALGKNMAWLMKTLKRYSSGSD